MDKNISRIVNTYIHTVLNQQPDLFSAYIFGSYARDNQREESDIDIALVIENLKDNDRFNTQIKLMLLAASIDNRIEPHPISKEELYSNNPFVLEILKTGIKLKVK
ncbi:MAG: nucleotidyltransferase domain-containing protein [Paludibacter sp.]